MDKILIVKVDSKYCDYLRKFDNKVSYNKDRKDLRPFIGVLFKIQKIEYFAPLSSPKKKHLKMKNTLDFLKIKGGEYGAVNFNNMIPVKKENYKVVDLTIKYKNLNEILYQELLINQNNWLNEHIDQIRIRSYKLYKKYIDNKLNINIKARCCNFKLLEEKCKEYNKK